MGRLHLGTSGYVYKHWRGLFYPRGLPASRWLPYYARVFSSLELNATFYRLPSPEAAASWAAQTPPGFRFAAKGSRFLTHMKKLTDVEVGLERFFAPLAPLGRKLAVVLWQLPPQLKRLDLPRLENFLEHLPRRYRHVFEFRSPEWYTEATCALLDRYGAALCEHDGLPAPIPRPTGGLRYVRFHGTTGRYVGRYGRAGLEAQARSLEAWCAEGHDAWVFFNNDLQGHALQDVLDFADLLGDPLALPAEAAELEASR